MAVRLCEACKVKYYESVIWECPKKPYICMYCCRKCRWHYRVEGSGMVGRKAWDEEHQRESGTQFR